MALGDPSDHLTVQYVKGRIQARCAMPLVIVSVALNLTRPQLQFGLGAIQSLDLRLFVNGQHQSVIQRVQVQTDNIKNLLSKVWIVADLERFQAMGLQICCTCQQVTPACSAISRIPQWVEPRGNLVDRVV